MSIEYVELTITDAEPINITISDIPEAASGGGGLSPIPAQTLLGNLTGSTALPTSLTAEQARTLLSVLSESTIVDREEILLAQELNGRTSQESAQHIALGTNRFFSERTWNATTYFNFYVDPTNGSDSNAGTFTAPFATLGAAIAQGNSVTIGIKRGSTINGGFTLVNQLIGAYGTGNRPIITHNSNATIQTSGSAILENLDIRSSATSATQATVVIAGTTQVRGCRLGSNDNKPITISGNGNIVEDCEMVDDAWCAQLCTLFQAQNAIVRRNTLTRTKDQTTNGFFIHGAGSSGNVIEGNRLISTAGKAGASVIVGFLVDSDFTDATPHVFRFNYVSGPFERYIRARRIVHIVSNIFDCRNAVTNAAAIESSHGTTLQVHGNTIIMDGTTLYSILVSNTSSNSTIVARNNILLATSGNPFYFGIGAVGCTYTASHNIYFGSTRGSAWTNLATGAGINWATYGPTETGGLNVDPLLTAPASNNFAPTLASPAVNAGLPVSGFDRRMESYSVNRVLSVESLTPNRGALQAAGQYVPPISHTHDASAINAGTLNIVRIPTGTTASTVCIGNDGRLSDARTPTAHTHPQSDITDLSTDLTTIRTAIREVITVALSGYDTAISTGDGKGFLRVRIGGRIESVTIDCDPNNEPSAVAVIVDCSKIDRSTGAATSVLSSLATITTGNNTGTGTLDGTQSVSAGDLLRFDVDQGSDGKELIATVVINPFL
jgi:hypothetical protein